MVYVRTVVLWQLGSCTPGTSPQNITRFVDAPRRARLDTIGI
jgi:hypothetical protein